jgi:ubiquinone biosynthesis protein
VVEVSRRWQRGSSFQEFSLGQLVLQSVSLGLQYRVFFPIEMVLMVKALITFEAVAHQLKPDCDVAAVSRKHVTRIFMQQFNPLRLAREGLRGGPELLDALVKAPLLISEGLRLLEQTTRRPAQNPLAGIRGTLFGGFSLLAGAILAVGAVGGQPSLWPLAALFFITGLIAALNKKS